MQGAPGIKLEPELSEALLTESGTETVPLWEICEENAEENPPVLLFLGFWFLSRKTAKLPRIFCPCQTHKSLEKTAKTPQKTKEIRRFKFTKEIQRTKEKKDWALPWRNRPNQKPGTVYEPVTELNRTKGRMKNSCAFLLLCLLSRRNL